MSSFTEEQLHDLLGHDGPPSIRELALQSMTTRNDALKDDHRDRRHQHPTMLNQTRELMQQQIKAETRPGLTEKQQHKPTVVPEGKRKKKRVHFAEEENNASAETIDLHQNMTYTTKKSNFLIILLVILAVSSLAYLYWPNKGSKGSVPSQ